MPVEKTSRYSQLPAFFSSRLLLVACSLTGRGTSQTHSTPSLGQSHNKNSTGSILGHSSVLLCFLLLPLSLSSKMTTPYLDPTTIDNMLACRQSRCNNRGTCVTPPGAGTTLVCNCDLGYKGDSCKDKVNGALSVPLTLSVFVALIGLVILAVIAAKFRRRQRKKQRKLLEQSDNSKAP